MTKNMTLALTIAAGLALGALIPTAPWAHHEMTIAAAAPAAPAPEPTDHAIPIGTNRFAPGYEPLVECLEDEDCWVGSGADGRDWAEVTWDMNDHGWEPTNIPTTGCWEYALDPMHGAGTLVRCEDGDELLYRPFN